MTQTGRTPMSRRAAMTWGVAMLALCTMAHGAVAQEAKKGDGLTADQIMDRMLEHNNALGVSQGMAKIELVIEDRTGDRRTRALEVRSKKSDQKSRSLVKLTAPKELAGQAFLFSENPAGEDDVWMYLPAFKVARRVEGSQKRGAFLGSHFSFSDLESRDMEQATYVRQADETIGKDVVYVIEVTPKKAESSDYGKLTAYVRQSDDMPLKLRFYDKDGKTEIKTLFVEKIERGQDEQPYIKQMTLRSKKGGFSTMIVQEVDTTVELPDALFTREQLGK